MQTVALPPQMTESHFLCWKISGISSLETMRLLQGSTFLVMVYVHVYLKKNGVEKCMTRITIITSVILCQCTNEKLVMSDSSHSEALSITLFSNRTHHFQMSLDSVLFEQLNNLRIKLILTQVGDKRNSWYLNPHVSSVRRSSFLAVRRIEKQLCPS